MIKCYDDKLFEPKIVTYTAKSMDENISEKFVKSLESSVNELYQKCNYNKVQITKRDNVVLNRRLDLL